MTSPARDLRDTIEDLLPQPWWSQAHWLDHEDGRVENLYCERCGPKIERRLRRLGGKWADARVSACWAGDDTCIYCRTCGVLLDSGGLHRAGVAEMLKEMDTQPEPGWPVDGYGGEMVQMFDALLSSDPLLALWSKVAEAMLAKHADQTKQETP